MRKAARVARTLAFEDLVAREKERLKAALAPAVAAEMGPPPGARPVSEARLAELWNLEHPESFSAPAIQKHATMPPDDPRRHPQVDRVVGLVQKAAAATADGRPETAMQLMQEADTHWSYPYRAATYEREPTEERQIRAAKRLKRLAEHQWSGGVPRPTLGAEGSHT